MVAKKVKWMKIPPTIFFFCKHFGTGVLIATAFVHVRTVSTLPMLSDAHSSYQLPSNRSTTHVFQICLRKGTLLCLVSS